MGPTKRLKTSSRPGARNPKDLKALRGSPPGAAAGAVSPFAGRPSLRWALAARGVDRKEQQIWSHGFGVWALKVLGSHTFTMPLQTFGRGFAGL